MNLILRSHGGFPNTIAFRRNASDAHFNSLIDSIANDYFGRAASRTETVEVSPRISASESEKAFEVEADLPGVSKENLKVLVDGKRVTIEADVKRTIERQDGEKTVQEESVVKKFSRTFVLASELDDALAVAKLENGVLTLTLPKKEIPQAKRILVQ